MTDGAGAYGADEVETLLKRERRRQGRERLGLMMMVAGMLIAGLTLMLADIGALSAGGTRAGFLIAAAVGVPGMVMTVVWKRGRTARRLDSLIGRRDRLQRVRNDRIYASSMTGWIVVAACLPALWRIAHGEGSDSELGFVAGATLSPWLVVMSVTGWEGLARLNRRWLEDEVTRDIRRRALSLGFLVLMAVMSVLFLVSLWEPAWAMVAFPAALTSAASVTGLRFVWLDQRAEDGEGG